MPETNKYDYDIYSSYQTGRDDTEFFRQSYIEDIKKVVTQFFSVYDIRWNEKTLAFYINLNKETLETSFENLRLKLRTMGYLPRLSRERGESVIYVIHNPKVKKRSIWVNIILIILTLITTTWAGAILWYGRISPSETGYGLFEPLLNMECILFGFLSFALPLMIILGTHETAHYLAAKKHKIDASLPFFIPLPPPFILGTMGAFISMREPISNKKALLDIGAAGPIAGFLVSLPILIIGFSLESLFPVTVSDISADSLFVFNEPLLFTGLRLFFPTQENTLMHPTAFAGWVGLFVTALNLIPGGQLDGGHIARALLGDKARYLSFIVIFILLLLSFVTSFVLWIFFALIIIFLGTSHPPPLNDISPLGEKRQAIGAFCMVMLLICIHYAPITEVSIPEYDLDFECENPNQVVDINGSVEYEIKIINKAKERINLKFSISELRANIDSNEDNNNMDINDNNNNNNNINNNRNDDINNLSWTTETQLISSDGEIIKNWEKIKLKSKDHFIAKVTVSPNKNLDIGAMIEHLLKVKITGLNTQTKKYSITTKIGTFDIFSPEPDREVKSGNLARFNISVQNIINQLNTIKLNYTIIGKNGYNLDQFLFDLKPRELTLGPGGLSQVEFNVTTPFNAEPGIVMIEISGISNPSINQNTTATDILNLTLEIMKR
jgi:Zn-dependent protease